ncbi:DUF7288 family protein [Halovivax limisalsi]|uniref:DUF7288 family protein n=1 Tax=Halovivax limisalsi TaxID=1453760 RepID=UPI001FFD06C1|nr:hypothetical protein [Halovivax limisalsi]
MKDTRTPQRAQAFTLEGFIGAIVLLTAVLFALQAVVITPTTGGAVDRGVQAQAEQEVVDALNTGQSTGNLSELVRYYDDPQDRWHNGTGGNSNFVYNNSQYANESAFGRVLDTHFYEHGGNSFNVEYIYWNGSGHRETIDAVRMGGARGEGAVSASFTVTLHDSQNLTEPGSDGQPTEGSTELGNANNYPIPDAFSSNLYNIVEVRVTVW